MKKIFFTISFIFISFYLSAQLTDAQRRAILASYTIETETWSYESAKGEACVKVIVNSFRTFGELPPKLNMEGLGTNDQLLCENLMAKLLLLQSNPPSWEMLVQIQEEHLLAVDKQMNRHSKYKTNDKESLDKVRTAEK